MGTPRLVRRLSRSLMGSALSGGLQQYKKIIDFEGYLQLELSGMEVVRAYIIGITQTRTRPNVGVAELSLPR